jgi:O-antigen ligase
LLFLAARKRRREGNPIRITRAVQVIVVVAIAGIALLSFQESIFLGWLDRIERLGKSIIAPQGTIALRVVLWTAAIKGFMTNPITGIGIGNFKIIDQIIPEVKLVPVWYYIGGLSAHNVVLHYLAETGIVGAISLIALAWTGLKTSFRRFREKQLDPDSQISAALFIAMFIFAFTILYVRAWTWGLDSYVLSMIFGLNAAWQWQRHARPDNKNVSRQLSNNEPV